jgi:hypothetical protein
MKKHLEWTDKEIVLCILQKLKGITLTDEQVRVVWDFVIGSAWLTRQEMMEVKQVIERGKPQQVITWSEFQSWKVSVRR